ncbi:MAG: sugar transferase [Bryobacterales bacterium]|nr:sugar transferase [Bryobacterales bacterium]
MSQPLTDILAASTRSRTSLATVIAPDDHSSHEILSEAAFTRMLCIERKRTERSSRRFVLMLLESDTLLRAGREEQALNKVLHVLSHSTRETDIKGWYKDGSVLSVIFTEIEGEARAVSEVLLNRVSETLEESLGVEKASEIRLSCHVFPEDSLKGGPKGPADLALHPDLSQEMDRRRGSHVLKRALDITGSLCALTIGSPVFLLIAAAVKLTSKGPVFYRQERVGQYGKTFTFLKFRSMKTGNDSAIHREYVTRLIAGKAQAEATGDGKAVYKLAKDPRITRVGGFLRRTSLDELPQFFNVLQGEMSLVGPRPPVPYEFECYSTWHKRRLLSVKPGITGLWQVEGRSRVKFDDMVRLDLRYAKSWSVWMDIKILLKTPRAVVSGAY